MECRTILWIQKFILNTKFELLLLIKKNTFCSTLSKTTGALFNYLSHKNKTKTKNLKKFIFPIHWFSFKQQKLQKYVKRAKVFPIELSLVFCAIVKGGQENNEALAFIRIIFILNINIHIIAGFKRSKL